MSVIEMSHAWDYAGLAENTTCKGTPPFIQATEPQIQPATNTSAEQSAIDFALAHRPNGNLGPLPLVGAFSENRAWVKPVYGLGQATIQARATNTDPWTGLKLGQVRGLFIAQIEICLLHPMSQTRMR